MGLNSSIQWTNLTWNIAVGCDKVDADCKFCYMYRDSMKGTRFDPRVVRKTKTVFDLPLRVDTPSWIFTCSYTDFFHEGCDDFRDQAWDIIRKCPQHIFQILTKRPERIADHLPSDWGTGWQNVILGTSVGSPAGLHRMVTLIEKRESKFYMLSVEPLHQRINLLDAKMKIGMQGWVDEFYVLPAYDWVIVGGESGNETGQYRYRPCELEWIESIVTDCRKNDIPVFVKQLGTHLAKELGLKDRHGGNMDEWPEHLRVRQFPNMTIKL